MILSFLLSFILSTSNPCPDLLQQLQNTSLEDWEKMPPTLPMLMTNNAALLTATEAWRFFHGWPHAFSGSFFVNTPLDMTITALSQQIAVGRAPRWLKNLVTGGKGYFVRAATNALVNSLVIISVWSLAAHGQGKSVDRHEMASAVFLCLAFYMVGQFVKNKLFIDLPRRMDRKQIQSLQEQLQDRYGSLIASAEQRAAELKIPKEQIPSLFVTAIEGAVLDMPLEKRLNPPEDWTPLKRSQSHRLRRKLIWNLIDEINSEKISSDRRLEIEKILHLGEPFTTADSLFIHEFLKKRFYKHRLQRFAATAADQFVGVVIAGGIFLRGLTESTLAD